jgi:tetratricopeptide (TPR) repeat protein
MQPWSRGQAALTSKEVAMNRLSLLRATGKVTLGGVLLLASSSLPAQSLSALTPIHPQNPNDASGVLPSAYQFRTDPAVAEAPVGIVGVHDLAIPPKSLKEFERSMKAFLSGDVRGAAGHLEKAVKIAPDFAQAHNNLGAMYINLRDYQHAMLQLQQAIDLDPKLESPYHNMAMLMIFLGRLPEAEAAARQALDLDAEDAVSRYWLGRILVMERQSSPEAEQLLTQAATRIPEARLWLAQILQDHGEISSAMTELRAYLQVGEAEKKVKVESWLAQLAKLAANQNTAIEEHQGS